MEKTVAKLASFVTQARFSALPDDVIHETKRVILDSIGCAIAGLATERGKITTELARRLGGPREATIIGTGDKVSCVNAAFANGELINALDFDALSPAVVHVVPTVIPAVLALAESIGASGDNLILAAALGCETSSRLKPAVADAASTIVTEGPEAKLRQSTVSGFSAVALAAAVSAAKILNLGQEKIANAIGIAGCICPPSIFRKFVDTAPVRMTKYGPPGWGAQVGVTSALLAEMGYTGDTDLFEGECGFWRYTGQEDWGTEEILANLGTKWQGHQIKYKQYPCGGVLAGVLDGFIRIIEENNFGPEDIDKIVAQPLAIVQSRLWRENTLRTPDDYSFNLLYLIACAAHRINPTHWQDPEVRHNPGIREFMQRVDFSIVADEKDFVLAKLEDPRTFQMRVELVAKGKTFREKIPYVKGAWEPEEYRNTDEELVKKFTDNTSRVLSLNRSKQAAQVMLELEGVDNVARVMEMVAP